jgi:hypothetical protein
MKRARARILLMALPLALGLVGCINMPITPVQPPPGGLYEDVTAPLTYKFDRTPATTPKVGMATSKYFYVPFTYGLLSFGWDPCNIDTAARNGGIAKIAYADYHLLNILGIYEEFTVIAHGD